VSARYSYVVDRYDACGHPRDRSGRRVHSKRYVTKAQRFAASVQYEVAQRRRREDAVLALVAAGNTVDDAKRAVAKVLR
jgi:hypothetical protein